MVGAVNHLIKRFLLSCVFLRQILDVNNQSFERISHSRALDILRGSTHLSITVKSNVVGKPRPPLIN